MASVLTGMDLIASLITVLASVLTGMDLTPAGYFHMTSLLGTLAAGRLVIVLEGGYNLRSIADSAAAVHASLLGDPPPLLVRRPPRSDALADIEAATRALAPYWACLRPPPLARPSPKGARAVPGALARPSPKGARGAPAASARDSAGLYKKIKGRRGRPHGPWWYRFLYS
jgi:hypothetical protein